MKKSDLKTGMRVRTRNNKIWLVVVDFLINGRINILFANEEGRWMDGVSYDDDLMMKKRETSIAEGYDIMEVYTINGRNSLHFNLLNLNKRYSIWKRQEYTEEQKEVFKSLKTLGSNYLAKDSDNIPYAYLSIPKKDIAFEGWFSNDKDTDFLNISYLDIDFDFIDWKDEKPFEIPE